MVKRNPAPFPDNVRYGDIVKGLPLGDETCSGVYCSHVLEHLGLDDFRKALANTKRLLKPGGIFRLVLPDLAFCISQYLASASPDAALEFMRTTGLGESSRARGVRGFMQELMGNSRHRWMWDYPSLERELDQAGFKQVRRALLGDSTDLMKNSVRWNAKSVGPTALASSVDRYEKRGTQKSHRDSPCHRWRSRFSSVVELT